MTISSESLPMFPTLALPRSGKGSDTNMVSLSAGLSPAPLFCISNTVYHLTKENQVLSSFYFVIILAMLTSDLLCPCKGAITDMASLSKAVLYRSAFSGLTLIRIF